MHCMFCSCYQTQNKTKTVFRPTFSHASCAGQIVIEDEERQSLLPSSADRKNKNGSSCDLLHAQRYYIDVHLYKHKDVLVFYYKWRLYVALKNVHPNSLKTVQVCLAATWPRKKRK